MVLNVNLVFLSHLYHLANGIANLCNVNPIANCWDGERVKENDSNDIVDDSIENQGISILAYTLVVL